jgi:hypothetical protein
MKTSGKTGIMHFAKGAMLVSICAIASAPAAGNSVWPGLTYFTVIARPGDTLATLAARYAVSAGAVLKLDGSRAPTAVTAGAVLRIPAGSEITRALVLREAVDPHTPNYASPPKVFRDAVEFVPSEPDAR